VTPEEVVRAAFQAWGEGRIDDIGELMAPDARWRGIAPDRAIVWCNSRDEILDNFRWVYQQLRDQIRVGRFTEAGDKVIVGLDSPVRATAANVITVRAGKIVFFEDYRDEAEALSTVGLTPSG
jgi:ketosteroid isomerase-like protein